MLLTTELVKSYRKVLNVICIIIIVTGIICGLGFGFYQAYHATENILFGILGAIGGILGSLFVLLLMEILIFAPMLVLFEIDEKLDSLNIKARKILVLENSLHNERTNIENGNAEINSPKFDFYPATKRI